MKNKGIQNPEGYPNERKNGKNRGSHEWVSK
jgi:hypothetical protein